MHLELLIIDSGFAWPASNAISRLSKAGHYTFTLSRLASRHGSVRATRKM